MCASVSMCCYSPAIGQRRLDLSLQANVSSEFLLLTKTGDGEWSSYTVMCCQERTEQCHRVSKNRLKTSKGVMAPGVAGSRG